MNPVVSPFRMLVVSDLHVDHRENLDKVRALADSWARASADVLVVAGDVSHKIAQLEATLRLFSGFPGEKLFVPGNHDLWIVREDPAEGRDSWEKLGRIDAACRRAGFHCLEASNRTVGRFTFVGTMGWYDYSFASSMLKLTPRDYEAKKWRDLTYMDSAYARWGMTDPEACVRLVDGVRVRLKEATNPIVFVSHHVPLEELVLRRGDPAWDFFNAYMGSRDLESLLRGAGVTRFVFGHTHRPVRLIEPGRFVINNPLGYPRQALAPQGEPFVVT